MPKYELISVIFTITFNFTPVIFGGFAGAFFSVVSGSIALRGVLETSSIKSLREIV